MLVIQIEKKNFLNKKVFANSNPEAIKPDYLLNQMKQKYQEFHCEKRKIKLLKLYQR